MTGAGFHQDPVISPAERDIFGRRGYIVVRRAIDQHLASEIAQAVYSFVGANPDDPLSWYAGAPRLNGVVNMLGHAAQWKLRQAPRIYQAFADLYQLRNLWVSIDRLKLTPPISADRPDWDHQPFIHWDIDTRLPCKHLVLQGLVALTDTTADQGGFQCVEGFPALFEIWKAGQPADRDPFHPNLQGLAVKPVPMNAGDLLIWSALLPHGNAQNRAKKPRLAQFVRCYPTSSDPSLRARRLSIWHEQSRDFGDLFAPSALGRRLIGLDDW